MQAEKEILRNYCYKCEKSSSAWSTKCDYCGNEDLIPDPRLLSDIPPKFKPIEGWVEGEAMGSEEEIVGTIHPEIAASIPYKSKLDLDETAVNKLINDDFGFLTGLAGTGKTTLINEVVRMNPDLFEVSATTGIAAVNLNTKTINSILKYFDTKSLENAWREQLLHMNLRKVRAKKKKLMIDECSMMSAEQFDLIINAVDEINEDGTGKKLGIWVVGDLCQLPPVKASYIFKSGYWDRFEDNTVRLTKVWRQDNLEFMKGINLIRAGDGIAAMKVFVDCGVKFTDKVNDKFEGTTLIPNNNDVDSYNEKRLRDVPGNLIRCKNIPSGTPAPEWAKLIPMEFRVKIDAYVMILCNDVQNWTYVNGDCGWVRSYDERSDSFGIELKRHGGIVTIPRIARLNYSSKEPQPWQFTPKFTPYNDYQTGDWVIGEIKYHPLRLAYASTIHKSQGLSLDMVQINTNPQFFGYDSMAYVSISRARTPEGLVLVGSPINIGRKVRMSKEVKKYV